MIITSQRCNLRDIVKIGRVLQSPEFKSHGFSVDDSTVRFSVSGCLGKLKQAFKSNNITASIQ